MSSDTCENLWLRRSGADPWEYDFILMDSSSTTWTFKQDDRIRRPLLNADSRDWLRWALGLAHPAHP